jgi:hypothetical protein
MHDSHRLAMAIWSINHFKILPNYKIEVSFADGTSGIADLAPGLSQGPAAVLDCNAAPKNQGSSVGELPTEE